jgi:tetratricopeptide (TPR) repeat protein
MFHLKNKKLSYAGIIILILLLAEIILHASNYRYAYQFFIQTDGRYTINRSYHYFQDSDLPLLIAPNFAIKKDSSTFRIFCLGDEATQGFPYPHHAAYPALLKQLLDSVQTTTKFEMINCALPGFNSQALLNLSRDVIKYYQPDLLILMAAARNEQGSLFATIPYINIKETPSALLAYLRIQYTKAKYLFSDKSDDRHPADVFIKNMEHLISDVQEAEIPMLINADGGKFLPIPLNSMYTMPADVPLTDSLKILAKRIGIPLIRTDSLSGNSTIYSDTVNTQTLLNHDHLLLAKALYKYFIENDVIIFGQPLADLVASPHLTNLDHLVAQMLFNRFYQAHANRSFTDTITFDTTAISQTAANYLNGKGNNLGKVHLYLGDQYKKKKRFDDALLEYQAALAYEPTAAAFSALGTIYIEKAKRAANRRDEENLAHRYFNQSFYYSTAGLSQYSENIDLTFNLGLLYFIRNDKLDKALDFFNKVLARNPENKNTMKYIAQIYLRLKEYARAKTFLQQALQIYPEEAQFHADLSLVYVAENNIELAEESVKKAFSLNASTQNKYLLYQVQSLRLKKEKREVIAK